MSNSIREYIVENRPEWLQEEGAKEFLEGLFDTMDAQGERAKEIVRARFPINADAAGLELAGRERQLPRIADELRETYAARISRAWEIHAEGGSARGMLVSLRAAGYLKARLAIVLGEAYHLNDADELVTTQLPAGSWLLDPLPRAFWSKFVLLFHHADGLPDGWGAGASVPAEGSEEMNRIRVLVRKSRPAWATFDGIVIVTQGGCWGWPPSTWGDGSTWGGDTVINYHP